MGCWSYYMFLYIVILHFGAYIFRGLVFCIVDVAHVECGYILNLLYDYVEFNFVS